MCFPFKCAVSLNSGIWHNRFGVGTLLSLIWFLSLLCLCLVSSLQFQWHVKLLLPERLGVYSRLTTFVLHCLLFRCEEGLPIPSHSSRTTLREDFGMEARSCQKKKKRKKGQTSNTWYTYIYTFKKKLEKGKRRLTESYYWDTGAKMWNNWNAELPSYLQNSNYEK